MEPTLPPPFNLGGGPSQTSLRAASRALSFEDGGSSGHHLPASSGIAIAWYCILVVVAFAVVLVLGACLCMRLRNRQRRRYLEEEEEETERQGQIDLEIARIEANVKVFAEQQEFIKKKHLQKAMCRQFVIVTEADLLKGEEGRKKYNFDEGCSICMEAFQVGDQAAHALSSKEEACSHLFHQDCILGWFVSRPEERCPVCRQKFADLGALQEQPPSRSRQSTAETQLFPSESTSSRSRQNTPESQVFPQPEDDPLALSSQQDTTTNSDTSTATRAVTTTTPVGPAL